MKAFLHMKSSLFPKKAWIPVLINDAWDATKHTNTHAAWPPPNKHIIAVAYAQMEFYRTRYEGHLLSQVRNSTAAEPAALWGIFPSLEKLPAHQEHSGNQQAAAEYPAATVLQKKIISNLCTVQHFWCVFLIYIWRCWDECDQEGGHQRDSACCVQ